MAEETKRRFSREFKLAALQRMLGGENVSALARELGLRRKYLYQWRERFRAGGPLALRSRGRPTKAEVLAMRGGASAPLAAAALADPAPSDALSKAECKYARNIGSDAILVMAIGRRGADHAGLEEVDFTSAVHLTFHELELSDLSFGLAVGPGRGDRRTDGRLVFATSPIRTGI
jgi:transposase